SDLRPPPTSSVRSPRTSTSTTLFRSGNTFSGTNRVALPNDVQPGQTITLQIPVTAPVYPTNYTVSLDLYKQNEFAFADKGIADRSEEHTSELQSRVDLVCRFLLEKNK